MKYTLYLLMLFSCISCHQAPSGITQSDVEHLMKKWEVAYQTKDDNLLAEILHDDYVYSGNNDGTRSNKEAVINELRTSDYRILKVDFEKLDIQYYNDMAIVRGNEVIHLLLSSEDTIQVPLAFTDVYQKQNGTVSALATHSSPRE